MPLFDDLITQYGAGDGATAPGQDAAPAGDRLGLFDDLVQKHANPAPDRGFFGSAVDAISGMGLGLTDALLAGAQHTTPIVNPNEKGGYTLAPQAEQDYFGEMGRPLDAINHVILRNPDTGQLAVYKRGENTDESALPALGRVLGYGAMAPSSLAIPRLGAPAINAVTNRIGSPENRALAQVGRAIEQDTRAGGPTAESIATSLRDSEAPLTIADVGGENVRGLAGQVARTPGAGRQQITQFLNDRDASAGGRLADAVGEGLGASEGGNYTVGQQLMQRRSQVAAPLYEKAYSAPPIPAETVAPTGELGTLMARPSMQRAATRALDIAREEGADPAALKLSTDPTTGSAMFNSPPSWRMLDYLKRGLDDVLETYRDTTTGRLNLDEAGRAIDQTRRGYLSLLDAHNPDLAAARAAYAGPSQSLGVLKQGAGIMQKAPDEIAAEIAVLSPSEKAFYRLGAANAVKAQLARVSSGGNEARAIIGNVYRQKQLQALFSSPADFAKFIKRATDENTMFSTRQSVLGGSQTAARLAQDGEGGGILGPLTEAGAAIMTREPVVAVRAAGRLALGAYNKLTGATPKVAEQTAGLLFQPGAPAADVIENAMSRLSAAPAPVRPTSPLVDAASRQETPPPPALLPFDKAADAVSKLGPGEPVTRRFLMDAAGIKSMDQMQAMRADLIRRGLISSENGSYRRAATINEPAAVAPLPPPIPPPSPAPPHPMREKVYRAAQVGAPTLRGRTFDELVADVDRRSQDSVLDDLGQGRVTQDAVHLLKRARIIPPDDWRALTSKAENWAKQFGISDDLPAPSRRDGAIATAYNLWKSGDLKLPPGLRRIMRGISDVTERAVA